MVRLPAHTGNGPSPDTEAGIDEETATALTMRHAAVEYLDRIGLVPVPDAIDQLTDVFTPCLAIICERGYEPNGQTWKEGGWRGLLGEIRKKFGRMWYFGWKRGIFHEDSPIDLINYIAYYVRLKHEGEPWGEWGNPGEDRM